MRPFLAIDPGPEQSAWVAFDPSVSPGRLIGHGIWRNGNLLSALRHRGIERMMFDIEAVVIEKVESFGMAVGAEVFETVYWSGIFAEAAASGRGIDVHRIGRRVVKLALCDDSRAKDPNIRQALLDRYGGAGAKGTKADPGPLYGVSKDVWSALAVAVTWAEQHR